ncbi:MAG: hypothetical protein MHMPM18_003818 [Marteilia pararefringens]
MPQSKDMIDEFGVGDRIYGGMVEYFETIENNYREYLRFPILDRLIILTILCLIGKLRESLAAVRPAILSN